MPVSLEVYVEQGCFFCRTSARLAAEVQAEFPEARVRLVDLAGPGGCHRHLVVAVPTFVLTGRVFSLGNRAPSDLRGEVARLLAEAIP